MAIKVKLLQKSISKGRKSLYLDFYPAIPNPSTNEMTRRQFLKMYIYERPRTPLEKQHNIEQLRLAEAIRQKRENELNKPEIYNEYEKEQLRKKELGEIDFVTYFRNTAKKRKGSNRSNWLSALTYLENFTNGKVRFFDVNIKFLEDFKDYLLTTQSIKSTKKKEPLSQNSALSYFNKIKASLKQAFKDGILQIDLSSRIESIKPAETRREYLTLDELNKLAKAPCSDEVLKRASLFSALTGLRLSDITNLDWDEIEYIQNQGYFIKFQQQKTKGMETLPISDQAYSFLGEPQQGEIKIFRGLKSTSYHQKALKEWLAEAGIPKHITFHCLSHNKYSFLLITSNLQNNSHQ